MGPASAPAGRLIVCPTPLGNLRDVTLRVLDALGAADIVACEDTRRTRILLERHGIVGRELVSFHEHNERARAGELVARMRAGLGVALVSDAGTPLVSDPGFALIRSALAAGLEVEVLPGPSAAITALVASGLPAERFRFVGFLPRRGASGGWGVRYPRRVRVARAAGRHAGGPRRARSAAAGGGLPGADQAARGSPPRERRRAGGALPRAPAAGGDRARRRGSGARTGRPRGGARRAARAHRRGGAGAARRQGPRRAHRHRRQRALSRADGVLRDPRAG
jgi:Tetrapyrrole (Corrin/Porphyrin) Methylases